MASTDGLCIFVCLLISIIGEVEGAVSSPPSNTVADVNGEAIFNCTATPSGPLAWVLTRDGIASGEIRIAALCSVVVGLENHYRTEQPGGPTTCSLVVFNITMEQAGVYHCTDSDTYRALLTVLDSSPVITDNSTTAVVENESVISECSLNYNGSVAPAPTLRPYFYWTNFNGQHVSSYYDSTTDNTAVSWLAVTAGRENITSYTCHVYLQLEPAATGGYANNTPTVDTRASSPTIEVLYGIGSVYVSYSIGLGGAVHLTCNTTGNPTPNYFWTGPKDITNISQPTIQIYTPDYYECNATNVIREEIHSNSSGINITEDYFPLPPSHSPSPPPFPSITLPPDQSNSSQVYTLGPDDGGSEVTTYYVAVAISVYEIANLISMGFFLVFYNMNSDANTNGNNSKVASNKKAFNNRFSWLEMMLPCMNESNENCGKRCLWIFFFSLITISCGVFLFPILVIIVMCCGKDLHGSQENSHLNLRMDDISVSMRGENNRFRPPPSSLPSASPSSHVASVHRQPTSSAGSQRPPPPPNKPMRPPPPPVMIQQMNREGEAVEYAFLPMARRPHLAPAQYLDDDETSHYAILRRV